MMYEKEFPENVIHECKLKIYYDAVTNTNQYEIEWAGIKALKLPYVYGSSHVVNQKQHRSIIEKIKEYFRVNFTTIDF